MKMIFNIKRLTLLLLLLMGLISGCSTGPSTQYTYSAPTSADGKACVDECEQSKAICTRLCKKTDPECLANAKERAQLEFQQYVDEQAKMQSPVRKAVQSFYHPELCNHTGCGCESEYKVCYQLCGTRTESHNAIVATGDY